MSRVLEIFDDFPGTSFVSKTNGNGRTPPLKRTRPEQACGALLIAPCGQIRFTSSVAARYLKKYFGPQTDRRFLPETLGRWANTRPDIPFCLVKDGRFLTVCLLDRNRKRALCVILEEHIIEEGLLNAREWLVMPWLREAKTNEEIGIILGMKTATVKKHVHRILEKLGVENRTAAAFYADRFFTAEE